MTALSCNYQAVVALSRATIEWIESISSSDWLISTVVSIGIVTPPTLLYDTLLSLNTRVERKKTPKKSSVRIDATKSANWKFFHWIKELSTTGPQDDPMLPLMLNNEFAAPMILPSYFASTIPETAAI